MITIQTGICKRKSSYSSDDNNYSKAKKHDLHDRFKSTRAEHKNDGLNRTLNIYRFAPSETTYAVTLEDDKRLIKHID